MNDRVKAQIHPREMHPGQGLKRKSKKTKTEKRTGGPMKTISVLIPCYNEEENVKPISAALVELFRKDLPEYNYEILFIDNNSTDRTRQYLREICAGDKQIKAIFNAKNFGQFNSPYYGLMQTTGDCSIVLCCDFQDPLECIPVMVREWEAGNRIIVMQKTVASLTTVIFILITVAANRGIAIIIGIIIEISVSTAVTGESTVVIAILANDTVLNLIIIVIINFTAAAATNYFTHFQNLL